MEELGTSGSSPAPWALEAGSGKEQVMGSWRERTLINGAQLRHSAIVPPMSTAKAGTGCMVRRGGKSPKACGRGGGRMTIVGRAT